MADFDKLPSSRPATAGPRTGTIGSKQIHPEVKVPIKPTKSVQKSIQTCGSKRWVTFGVGFALWIIIMAGIVTAIVLLARDSNEDACSGYTCPSVGSETTICVTTTMLCDGKQDCSTGLDEENCPVPCGLFRCASGRNATDPCSEWATRCNGFAECVDGEDEVNCTSVCEDAQACPTEPATYEIEYADGCVENIGRCEGSICSSCGSSLTVCCGATNRTSVTVTCGGQSYTLEKILSCGCQSCEAPRAFISGKVTCNATETCEINFDVNGQNISRSDANGDFSFYTEFPTDESMVFTLRDASGRHFPQVKIINVVADVQFYTLYAKMRSKPTPVVFSSSAGASLEYGEDGKFAVEIPPDSITSEEGAPYNGQVNAYTELLDPTTIPADDAPTDLRTPNDDVMISLSMIQMSLEGDDGQQLNGRTSVSLAVEGEQDDVQMWDYTAEDGWCVQSNLTTDIIDPTSSGRKKRSSGRFLLGSVSIRAGRETYNFDYLLRPYCYLKVRVFSNKDASESDQLRRAEVFVVLQNAKGVWMTYQRRTVWGKYGACLQVPCNDATVKTLLLSATYDGEPLYPYSLEEGMSEDIGIPPDMLQRLQYSRRGGELSFTVTIPDGTGFNGKGPVYPPHSYYYYSYSDFFTANNYASLSSCHSAPFSDNHFRFYSTSPAVGDIMNNVIPISEDSIFSPWISNILAWWQNPVEFKACYIRVLVSIWPRSGDWVKVVSSSGSHPTIRGSRFGDRQSREVNGLACVEFKCSDYLIDQVFDRTAVTVSIPNGSYVVNYVNYNLPTSDGYNSPTFSFLSSTELESDETSGLFTASAKNPVHAKRLARNKCFSATFPWTAAVGFGDYVYETSGSDPDYTDF